MGEALDRAAAQAAAAILSEPDPPPRQARAWSAARPTTCAGGHRHASRLEAAVCERVTARVLPGQRLLQQLRLPLLTLAPDKRGRPLYASVDFAIVGFGGRIERLIDAKGRVSREWRRGAAALEAAYGIPVEEVRRAADVA